MPTRMASIRTGKVRNSEADKPIKKASRPELMSPSYVRSEELARAKVPVIHRHVAGFGSGSRVNLAFGEPESADNDP